MTNIKRNYVEMANLLSDGLVCSVGHKDASVKAEKFGYVEWRNSLHALY